jgi:hypothetical protein
MRKCCELLNNFIISFAENLPSLFAIHWEENISKLQPDPLGNPRELRVSPSLPSIFGSQPSEYKYFNAPGEAAKKNGSKTDYLEYLD